MVTIRLSRTGKTKHATYRVVVMDKARDPWSKHLEIVAAFDPHAKERLFNVKADRIKYWLDHGAQPSGTMRNLLIDAGLFKGEKVRSINISNKRRAKMAKKAEAAKPKEEAAAAPAEKVQ